MNDVKHIEEYLKENGTLTYNFRGTSMNPLLKQGRDLVTIASKTAERCKKYDVVLYRSRTMGRFILHRVIDVREKDYVILGDNCIAKEYGICDEDIIGTMTSFCRKGKVVDVTDWRYRLYSRFWVKVHPMINIIKRIKRKIVRLKREMLP